NKGISPTPGPKGTGAPGPHAGASASNHPGPAAPITVTPTSAPSSRPGNGSHGTNALSNKLRALLLPTGEGTAPKQAHITPGYGSISTELEPTPPPDVLAQTHFTYTTAGTGTEKSTKMWVTSIRRVGPLTICTGWLVRHPFGPPKMAAGPAPAPIVEANVTFICSNHLLKPYP
ncbi:MAG: hypothetical protein M3R30_07410, partial [Candidatus Eremiobacteraeota bacterium]|nr:hypothetical protein [Candidatus Eremiobacteraeota bacterium]